jgi:hypothetical protein
MAGINSAMTASPTAVIASDAKQSTFQRKSWIASSQMLLAMTRHIYQPQATASRTAWMTRFWAAGSR